MARTGHTQATLADLIGMKQQAFSRRLTGQTQFTLDEIVRVADALGVPIKSLLGDEAVA
jgi:transcriptional regulator with XRE-family HTH domain